MKTDNIIKVRGNWYIQSLSKLSYSWFSVLDETSLNAAEKKMITK